MQTILNFLLPHMLELLALILTGVIGWAAAAARAKWGIDIEARHREALHSALMTGARMALQRGLSGPEAVTLATGYAESSVPDAIARLRPSESVLTNLARAKIAEVTAR
jgi:hypothetical protein